MAQVASSNLPLLSSGLLGKDVEVTYCENEQETTIQGKFLKKGSVSVWIAVGFEIRIINVQDIISMVKEPEETEAQDA